MPDLLTYAKRLQQDKYGKLEAELKSIAIASVALPDSIKLPTFQEQASLKAEKVVAKYRHHLEPLSSSSSSENSVNNNVMNKSRNKSVNRQKKLMVLFNPMNLSKSKGNNNSLKLSKYLFIGIDDTLVIFRRNDLKYELITD
ncbi:unnamed protein product [Trichobilharzia regenti]|nr:unnamed protein product [Trichobilharzia regenti]